MSSDAASPDIDLVTLGSQDVEPARLAGPGRDWTHVLPEGDLEDAIPLARRSLMPQTGWRLVFSRPAAASRDEMRVLAAPQQDGWALAYLVRRDGRWILTGDTGPYRPRPGRARRRQGLALGWPATALKLTRADLATLAVVLRNTSSQRWVADPQDSGYVRGWLVGEDDQRLGSGFFSYAPLHTPLHDLEPGQTMLLPVDLGERPVDAAPGTYRLDAALVSLDLWAERAGLRLS